MGGLKQWHLTLIFYCCAGAVLFSIPSDATIAELMVIGVAVLILLLTPIMVRLPKLEKEEA